MRIIVLPQLGQHLFHAPQLAGDAQQHLIALYPVQHLAVMGRLLRSIFRRPISPAPPDIAGQRRGVHALLQSSMHRRFCFRLPFAQLIPYHSGHGLYLLRRACRLCGSAERLRRPGRIGLCVPHQMIKPFRRCIMTARQPFQHGQQSARRPVDTLYRFGKRLPHCARSFHRCAVLSPAQMVQGGKLPVILQPIQQICPDKARFGGQLFFAPPAICIRIEQMEQVGQQRCGSIQPIGRAAVMERHTLQPCRTGTTIRTFRPLVRCSKIE